MSTKLRECPLTEAQVDKLAQMRGVPWWQIERELRTVVQRQSTKRRVTGRRRYSWHWVSSQLVPLLYELIPDEGITLDALYWLLRLRIEPLETQWITVNDVETQVEKCRCPIRCGLIFPPS